MLICIFNALFYLVLTRQTCRLVSISPVVSHSLHSRGDKNIIVDGGAYGGHMRATQSFRYVEPPIW